nr:hypothetical protein [Brevundimonas intermedia]
MLGQTLAHLIHRQGEIDHPGGDRAFRHIGVGGTVTVGNLGQGQPTMLLDGLGSQRSVPVAARQHDGHGVFLLVLRQRREKNVDRLALALGRLVRTDRQHSVSHGGDGVGRQDVNAADLDRRPVLRDVNRHVGVARDDRVQHAFPLWIEVGDDHHGEARRLGNALEEPLQRLHAARRGAHADDWKA